MTDEKISAPASHWRRRTTSFPIPAEQAVRQGEITRLTLLSLGKDEAMAFLNTEHPELGGRPLALATASEAGLLRVRTKLQQICEARAGSVTLATPS